MNKFSEIVEEVRDWWKYKGGEFEVTILMTAFIFIFAVGWVMTQIEKSHCENFSQLYGDTLRVEYAGFPTGCMVQLPSGMWVDVDNAGYLELGEQ